MKSGERTLVARSRFCQSFPITFPIARVYVPVTLRQNSPTLRDERHETRGWPEATRGRQVEARALVRMGKKILAPMASLSPT